MHASEPDGCQACLNRNPASKLRGAQARREARADHWSRSSSGGGGKSKAAARGRRVSGGLAAVRRRRRAARVRSRSPSTSAPAPASAPAHSTSTLWRRPDHTLPVPRARGSRPECHKPRATMMVMMRLMASCLRVPHPLPALASSSISPAQTLSRFAVLSPLPPACPSISSLLTPVLSPLGFSARGAARTAQEQRWQAWPLHHATRAAPLPPPPAPALTLPRSIPTRSLLAVAHHRHQRRPRKQRAAPGRWVRLEAGKRWIQRKRRR
eukprot:3522897-Rhodomonas_salina.1